MAEIDTTAPFASVRDAVNMFGELSPVKPHRIFPTATTVNIEKIASLEAELHQTQDELAKTKLQLVIAESTKVDALKELADTKDLLEKNTKKLEDDFASENNSWQAQLDAALEQQSGARTDLESGWREINRLQVELEESRIQQGSTLRALARAQEENDGLKEQMLNESKALADKQEREAKEAAEIVAQRVDELIKDLYATKGLLAKVDAAREGAERELLTSRETESERLSNAATTAALEVEKVRGELKEAEEQQDKIITEVEKLKAELIATKEAEKRAARAEEEANLNLQRMKLDVEDAKVATEKARAMAFQLEESNTNLKMATETERILLASLASLKAELNNTKSVLMNLKKEADESAAEMEEQIGQLQAELVAATLGEAKTKESLSGLNEALRKVSAEADKAKVAATTAKFEAASTQQELEQALAHGSTLQSRLQASTKETEAAKASEAFALAEVKSVNKRLSVTAVGSRNGPEVTLSHDEYEALNKKVQDSNDLANKRVTAAIAQAEAARAGEQEMLGRMEAAKHLIDSSQVAMKQAIHRAEAAEAAKSAVEGELRRWRSESEQRRKAAVAAVVQVVGSNGGGAGIPAVSIGDGPLYRKGGFRNESNVISQMGPGIPRPKESLAQVLQYNFPCDEKAKKNTFSTKLGSYFSKKVK